MRQINEDKLRGMVRLAIQMDGSQKAFAQRVGVSEQYLVDVMKSRRAVPKKILDWLGYERVVLYRRKRDENGSAKPKRNGAKSPKER